MLHKNNKLRFGAAIVAGLMSAGCLLSDISVAMAAPPPPPHRDDRRKPAPPRHDVKPMPPRHDVKPAPPRPARPDVRPAQPKPPRPDVRPQPPGPRPHPAPPPGPKPKPHPVPPPPGPRPNPHPAPPPPPPHHREHKDTNGSFWTGLIVGGIAGAILASDSGSANPNTDVSHYNDAVIYDEAGVKAYDNGEYDKAIDKFDKAIYADRSYMYAYIHRGKAYLAKGMYNAAKDDAEECIRVSKDRYAEAYVIRAKVRQYQGESLYDVRFDLDQAIRIEPNNRLWYYERAKVNRELGYSDAAASDFNRAWEMSTSTERTEMYADYYNS